MLVGKVLPGDDVQLMLTASGYQLLSLSDSHHAIGVVLEDPPDFLVLEKGFEVYSRGSDTPQIRQPVVITGAALGLPGTERVFDDANIERLLRGDQFITPVPDKFRQAMVDKNIVRPFGVNLLLGVGDAALFWPCGVFRAGDSAAEPSGRRQHEHPARSTHHAPTPRSSHIAASLPDCAGQAPTASARLSDTSSDFGVSPGGAACVPMT